MNGRTIKVFLANGVPDGLRTAEIMNWTGKMLVFPRSQLADFVRRQEAGRTGIYVLIGDDPNDSTRERIYIGESDSVSDRLQQHAKDANKDFWNRTIVVISKDENLSKAHVRYLESRLIGLAKQAKRAIVGNGNSGAPVSLAESDTADMEFFLSQIQVLLPVLGYPFAQPLPAPAPAPSSPAAVNAPAVSSASPPLIMNVGNQNARAYEAAGTFIVRAGSMAQANPGTSMGNTYRQLRDSLIQSGSLGDAELAGYLKFVDDTPFNSPSAAATIILGYNANGRTSWRIEGTTTTYKEWQDNQVAAASASVSAGADEEPTAPEATVPAYTED